MYVCKRRIAQRCKFHRKNVHVCVFSRVSHGITYRAVRRAKTRDAHDEISPCATIDAAVAAF